MKTRLRLKPLYHLCAAGVMLLMLSADVQAQHWALPSSRWHLHLQGGFPPDDWDGGELYVQKDTTIYATPCKIITGGYHNIYTYESGDTVYFFRDSAFRSMYYFGAHVGDTISIYNDTMYSRVRHTSELHAVIDSILLVSIQGQQLKQFYATIDSYEYSQFPRGFIYTEKIGINRAYEDIFFFNYSNQADGVTTTACNYGDSSINGFWLYPAAGCQALGIQEQANNLSLICHPNPSTGTFTIDLPMPGTKELHIYDALGQLVYIKKSMDTVEILTPEVAAGMYTIEVKADQRYYRAKIIVQ